MLYSKVSKTISILLGIIMPLLIVVFVIEAWTEPAGDPPGNNVDAPVNIGNSTQYKTGDLGIGGALSAGALGIPANGFITMDGGDGAYLKIPNLNIVQRDALSPEVGMIIFNTETDEFEGYYSGAWKIFSSTSTVYVGGGLPNGEICTLDESCSSDFCTEGRCCNERCQDGLTCQTCGSNSNLGVGTCGYAVAGTDPHGSCNTSGCQTGSCKGDGNECAYYTSGHRNCDACYSCDANGQCQPQTNTGSAANALGCTSGESGVSDLGCRSCNNGNCTYFTSGQRECSDCGDCNASGECDAYWPACTDCESGRKCSGTGSCLSVGSLYYNIPAGQTPAQVCQANNGLCCGTTRTTLRYDRYCDNSCGIFDFRETSVGRIMYCNDTANFTSCNQWNPGSGPNCTANCGADCQSYKFYMAEVNCWGDWEGF